MKIIIQFLFIAIAFTCMAQNAEDEIDQEIWMPFTKAWEANDGEAFNSIHSDNVWRINPGRLSIGDEYKSRNAERMKMQKKNSIIEFSFETRTSNRDNAYEVGYYRITNNATQPPSYFVGRFHVALKKINGAWKITQDWDTDEINGIKITAESLEKRDFIHFE